MRSGGNVKGHRSLEKWPLTCSKVDFLIQELKTQIVQLAME
jgi:hypothetical protein